MTVNSMPFSFPPGLLGRGSPLPTIEQLIASYGGLSHPCQNPTGSVSPVINSALATGRNIALDSGFDTGTPWTLGTGWSVVGGVASQDGTGTGATLTQSVAQTGLQYKVTFTIKNYSSGGLKIYVGGNGTGTYSANGTYSETMTAVGAIAGVRSVSFVGDVDDLTIQQVNIAASASYPGAELLTDGDMEAADTSAWASLSGGTLSKQTTNPHSGSRVLRVTIAVADNIGGATQNVKSAGKRYRYTGYARGDGVNGAPALGDAAGNDVWIGTTSAAWQKFDVEFVAAGTAGLAKFSVVGNAATEDYAEFDDVSFTEVNPMNGDITGMTVGVSAGAPLGRAYSGDGATSYVDVYSQTFNSFFNPDAGTLIVFAKVSGAGVWTDGVQREIVILFSSLNAYVRLLRSSTDNTVRVDYVAAGTAEVIATTSIGGTTDMFMIAATWEKPGNVTLYINGEVTGTPQAIAGTWSGNLSATETVIGARNITPAEVWSGLIAYVTLLRAAATPAEILQLAKAGGVA